MVVTTRNRRAGMAENEVSEQNTVIERYVRRIASIAALGGF